MENVLLTLLVCNVPKLNLRKFLIIYYENLKLSLQNRFLQMFLRFFILKLFASYVKQGF